MRDGYVRGALSPHATQRQMDALAAYVTAGGSVQDAADSWASGRVELSTPVLMGTLVATWPQK